MRALRCIEICIPDFVAFRSTSRSHECEREWNRKHSRTRNLVDDINWHPLMSRNHTLASKSQYPSEQSISSSIILFICSYIEVTRTRCVPRIIINLSLTGSVINSVRAGFQAPAAHTASAALSAQVIPNLEVVSTCVCLRRSCPLKNVSSKSLTCSLKNLP